MSDYDDLKARWLAMDRCREAGDITGEIAVGEDVRTRFGGRPEEPMRDAMVVVLSNLGYAYHRNGDDPNAVDVWEELRRCNGSLTAGGQRGYASGLFGLAVTYTAAGHEEDKAVAVWEELRSSFGRTNDPAIMVRVAEALSTLTRIYVDADRLSMAVQAGEQLRDEYGAVNVPGVQLSVRKGMSWLQRAYERRDS